MSIISHFLNFSFSQFLIFSFIVVRVQINHLGNEVFLHTMLTVGTTDTRFLHTGVEALDSLEVHTVDIGLAELNLAADACSGVNVLGKYRRGKTIFAVVGPLDNLVDIVELHQWQYRTERLFMDDVHILSTVVKNSSRIEITLALNRSTATENLGTLLHGVVDLLRHTLQGSLLHQRTHIGILHDSRIAHLHGLELLHDDIGEFLLDILMDIYTLGIVTNLTGVADTALQDSLGCQFEVCIREYDGRSLTA